MQFDPALAAQQAFSRAEAHGELGADWAEAAEAETAFSSNAGSSARAAYEQLLALAARYPKARSYQAFCIFITWQQVMEETLAHHFQTGITLCEAYLAAPESKEAQDLANVAELYRSFRDGLGLNEEDAIQVEFRRDEPRGGD